MVQCTRTAGGGVTVAIAGHTLDFTGGDTVLVDDETAAQIRAGLSAAGLDAAFAWQDPVAPSAPVERAADDDPDARG